MQEEQGVGPLFSSGDKHKEFRSIALASFNDKEAFGKYTRIVGEEASELVRFSQGGCFNLIFVCLVIHDSG